VRRVAYAVEQARVGQKTDFDKLTLDIETDGSIDPQAALREAARAVDLTARHLHRRGPHPGAQSGPEASSTATAWRSAAGPAGPAGEEYGILIEELELEYVRITA